MGDIVNNKAHHRFELVVDDHLAAAFYKVDGNVITFMHTEVPPELGGRGVGSTLVQGALDQVRASGMKVIADFRKALELRPDLPTAREALLKLGVKL